MISRPWRERLTYTAMSAFVAWHTLALVVVPAPDGSAIAQSSRQLLHPYLALFRLDNRWDFYAPAVGKGRQFRYELEDASGMRYSFTPTDKLSWFHPDYWWFRAWYDAVMDYPETYADQFAGVFCRKHADLRPVSITLQYFEVESFAPKDHLSGKHPLDSEFVAVTTLQQFKCPTK